MKVAPTPDPSPDDLGPHMLALDERQRRFVVGYLGDAKDASKCAAAAGYSTTANGHRVQAHRLLHNPKVIAAIKEEAGRRLNGAAYIAAAGLAEIAADPTHKDRYKASADILDRTGFPRTLDHSVSVDDRTDNRSTSDLLGMVLANARRYVPHLAERLGRHPSPDQICSLIEPMRAIIAGEMLRRQHEGEPVLIEQAPGVGVTATNDFEENNNV